MNLLAKKFQLIEWLAGVEDEKTVSKVAALRKQTAIEAYEASLQPIPLEEAAGAARGLRGGYRGGSHLRYRGGGARDWLMRVELLIPIHDPPARLCRHA